MKNIRLELPPRVAKRRARTPTGVSFGTVTRTVAPTLRQVNKDVLLLSTGDARKPDQSLLDLRLGRRFEIGRGVTVEPLFEIYNLLNENASVTEVEQVGPAVVNVSVTMKAGKPSRQ